MTFNIATKLKLTAAGAVAAVGLMTAVPADAIVPPRNCGTTTVNGKRYQIKSDQLRCTTAKRYARNYLRTRSKPRYYTCKRGARGSSLVFRCVAARYNPDRTFFAIRK